MNSAVMVRLKDLEVGYTSPLHARHVVSSGINLSLYPGELVCLLGPNGAGKSTLLRTIAAMQKPLACDVLLRGQNIHSLSKAALARRLSVVLTERVSAGLLTAYDVVALGRSPYTGWSGTLRDEDRSIIDESINAVDAGHLAARMIGELSDGLPRWRPLLLW